MFQNGMKGQALTPLFFAFCFGMVLSTLINQKPPAEKPASPLITFRGIDKNLEDLPKDLATKLSQQHQRFLQERKGLLEDAALRLKLIEFSAREQVSLEQAAEQLYLTDSPTDSDIAGYYAMHRAELDKPFYMVEGTIRKRLEFERARARRAEVLTDLIAKGDLIIHPNTL